MAGISWAERHLLTPDQLGKLHDPIGFAKTFDLKRPQVYCANEDCVYLAGAVCPAGSLKANCPNKSVLDYKGGCQHYVGIPYQYDFLSGSMSGKYQIIADVTGRGTGKSAVKATQKVLMEATTEPYVRGMLFRTAKPIPAKIIVVGNTQDTSLLLRQHIHNAFESNDILYSFVKDDTKTKMTTHSGAEIWFKTAGVDGKGLRGYHAEVIKNVLEQDVKCTIIWVFDEAWFTRAPSVIADVMIPALQVGNNFSQILVTTTPYNNHGEIYELTKSESPAVKIHNFASYHNKYSNLDLLLDFKNRCKASGQGSIYNREILGRSESDDGLYFPFDLWIRSIDDRLDWITFNEIERGSTKMPGLYYCGVDPNHFRQLQNGDFAAYLLVWCASDRSMIKPVSFAKYQLDLEGDFKGRLKKIDDIYSPRFMVDANSGFALPLQSLGLDARAALNSRMIMNPAMRLCKEDMVDRRFKMPASDTFEEERKCFVQKEDGVGPMPKLDHRGSWGQGYSSDLMRCLGYVYVGIMQDFGIQSTGDAIAGNTGQQAIAMRSSDGMANVLSFEDLKAKADSRIRKVIK